MAIALQRPAYPDEAQVCVTHTGFTFGAVTVDRICTLPKGGAAVRIATKKVALTVRVTKSGKLIITTDSGEEVRLPATPARAAGDTP